MDGDEFVLFVGIVDADSAYAEVTLVCNAIEIREIRHSLLDNVFGTSAMYIDGFCMKIEKRLQFQQR